MSGQRDFLLATAVGEAGTGIVLLTVPTAALSLLLGIESAAAETRFVSRVAGAALLAIGIACWFGRNNRDPTAGGLLPAALIYDIAAAGLLAYAGSVLNLVGLALWPAVVLHGILAIWCAALGRYENCKH